jgi:ubiquinol-cytochrome c reductase cytochrome c1 subunit
MKEFKILAILVLITGALYWGVEPYAHSQMHPHVDAPDYSFSDLKDTNEKGDAKNGAILVQSNCIACHSINTAGFAAPMDAQNSAAAYGVVPPDLSNAGLLYEAKFLAAFIKDPAKATNTTHKYTDGKMHPMPSYSWMNNQEIADMVAYIVSIAPKKVTNKEVFKNACQRCHSIKYADFYGTDMRANSDVTNYMGTTPPDLSQHIRSRSNNYLHEFINNPQKHLLGTSMPRVGLTLEAENQVIAYLEEVGDSKKEERESLGPKFLVFLLILSVLAWLWKKEVWKEVK